jgi:hypothetical protein
VVQSQPEQIVHKTLSPKTLHKKKKKKIRAGEVAQGEGTKSKPQYCKKKNRKPQLLDGGMAGW